MSTAGFFLRTALSNLRRGGQRSLVALLCITFGVMALVAMLLLSESIERMLVVQPQHLVGADISMVRRVDDFILPEHIQRLEEWKQEGLIERYTLAAYTSSLSFRRPGSGELHFPAAGIGIDPAVYPPIGHLTIGAPSNTGLVTLLQEPGDILITRDIAIEYGLKVGDPLTLADLRVGAPLDSRVRGIVTDTPNHQGSKIYYNLASARLLAAGGHALNTALLAAPDPNAAREKLEPGGWSVYLASGLARSEKQIQEIFRLSLSGAGMLGLLVGGVGIANTMQVLLRRRRKEVAVWKTLGYRSGELALLFAIEALLLGATGSLLGAGLGVAISRLLVDLFSRTTTLLIQWAFSPIQPATGMLVGMITTVTFAMYAIVVTSQEKPLALLRDETPVPGAQTRAQGCGLAALLALPLVAVASLVIGSLLYGVLALMAALVGIVALGGLLGLLMRLFTRLLPLRAMPLANMARAHLRRGGLGLIFAMLALFIGVVSLALGTVVTQNAHRVLDDKTIWLEGSNITILAPAGQEASIHVAAARLNQEHFSTGYQATVRAIRSSGGEPIFVSNVLIGREEAERYRLSGAAWGSQPNAVYVPQGSRLADSSQVEVTLWDGTTCSFPVAGTYYSEIQGVTPQPGLGLLMNVALLKDTTQPETVQFFLTVPAGQVQTVSTALGVALPDATVVNLVAYAARFSQTYQNLFVFAVAMAGLALLAGVLLVANSVSLAMLDRRYEIGVLKAMGYTRRHILSTLVVEYSLVALFASGSGLVLVSAFLWVMGRANPLAGRLFVMPLPTAASIALVSLGLTLTSVLLSTWKPVHVSPVVVLNDRE